jgi:Amt family ammonium transporter
MIATGIFAQGVGLIHGDPKIFLFHLLAVVIVSVYSFAGSYLLYKLTDAIIPLRVFAEHEEIGLDLSQHGETMVSSNGTTNGKHHHQETFDPALAMSN